MQAIVENLKSTAAKTKATDLHAAFAADDKRFERFSARFDDLVMDYSKCAVNEDVLSLLEKLVMEPEVKVPIFVGRRLVLKLEMSFK